MVFELRGATLEKGTQAKASALPNAISAPPVCIGQNLKTTTVRGVFVGRRGVFGYNLEAVPIAGAPYIDVGTGEAKIDFMRSWPSITEERGVYGPDAREGLWGCTRATAMVYH